MAVSKQQKQIALVAGAALILILVYKWYSSQQAGAASTGAVAPNTSSGDYASLAGQEQSDMAAVQGQNSQLQAQEQSDVAALQGSLGGLTGQEQSDISGLTGSIAGFSDQFDQLTTGLAGLSAQTAAIPALTTQVAGLASGVTQLNRAQAASVQTHRNGPFYNYYVKVIGKPPPANVRTSNFVYQAWKSGVGVAALQKTTPHPSSKNTQIAHPNGNHTQQSHQPPAPAKAAPKPSTKPSAAKPQPAKPAPRQLPKPKPKPPARRK